MKSNKKYFVVHFVDEGQVEVIANAWLAADEKTARWPKGLSVCALEKAIVNQCTPEEDWETFNVHVYRGTTLQKLFGWMETTNLNIRSLKKNIDSLRSDVSDILTLLKERPGGANNSPAEHDFSLSHLLPLQNSRDLKTVEALLQDVEEVYYLGAYLAKAGGHTDNAVIRRIVQRAMAKAFVLQYSAAGRSGKKKNFSALQLYKAVEAAACRLRPNMTDCDILKKVD